jgi:protein-export membrane protein SecD
MQRNLRTKIFLGLLILSFIVVFFVGKEYNPTTGTRTYRLSRDAVTDFRRGLDISGGSRLIYQIDYSKYEQIYTDPVELSNIKKNIETIILKNIDQRISALGVSDYRSYIQTMNNENYVIVEIGGIADLEEAKKIIGKTVELEFRLPNQQEASPEIIAQRKQNAQEILNQASNGRNLEELWANKGAAGITYNMFSQASLSELPNIYRQNTEILNSMQTGTVYSVLREGPYHTFQSISGEESINGFVIFKLIDKQIIQNQTITANTVIQAAESYGKDYQTISTLVQPRIAPQEYSYSNRTLTFNNGEVFSGQYAYDARIIAVPKPSTMGLGNSPEEIEQATQALDETIEQVKSRIKNNNFSVEGTTLINDDWIDSTSIKQAIPGFSDSNEEIIEVNALDAHYVIYNRQIKEPNQNLYQTIQVSDIAPNQQAEFEESLRQTIKYTIEEIFVQESEQRVPAIDDQNRILNGTYFRMASVSTSQLGQPVVLIQLDETGKQIFCNITENNIGEQMAIFVGWQLLTAPVIQDRICGGTAQIDGQFTASSAKELVSELNDGTLPAPLITKQVEKISPTLGQNALRWALIAAGVSIIIVTLLMGYMYGKRKALVTLITLALFLLLLFAFIKLVDYALSLSAIAAIILTIGMSVDANIIIFERIREELKEGKTMQAAIESGYSRSRSAIRDGNLSTWLIALLLFTLGINIFKGFGSMMIVNIILVLYIGVPLIKELLHIMFKNKHVFLEEEGKYLQIKE